MVGKLRACVAVQAAAGLAFRRGFLPRDPDARYGERSEERDDDEDERLDRGKALHRPKRHGETKCDYDEEDRSHLSEFHDSAALSRVHRVSCTRSDRSSGFATSSVAVRPPLLSARSPDATKGNARASNSDWLRAR